MLSSLVIFVHYSEWRQSRDMRKIHRYALIEGILSGNLGYSPRSCRNLQRVRAKTRIYAKIHRSDYHSVSSYSVSPPETVTISEDAIMEISRIGCSYLFMVSSISIVVVHSELNVSRCAATVERAVKNAVNEVAGLDLDGVCRGIGIRHKEGTDEVALIVKGSYIGL